VVSEGGWIVTPAESLLRAWADDEIFFATFLFGRSTHVGPDLERTLALASVGQEEFGHAELILELLVPGERDRERYFFEREASEYYCCSLLQEELLDDWAAFVVRAFLYEEAEAVRLERVRELLERGELAGLGLEDRVQLMVREEAEHRAHWLRWIRLLGAESEGRKRARASLEKLAEKVGDVLCLPAGGAEWWRAEELRNRWARRVGRALESAGIGAVEGLLERMQEAGEPPRVSEGFEELVRRFQGAYRQDMEARTWG